MSFLFVQTTETRPLFVQTVQTRPVKRIDWVGAKKPKPDRISGEGLVPQYPANQIWDIQKFQIFGVGISGLT